MDNLFVSFMAQTSLRFLLLLVMALLVGTMFGIWVGYNPASLSVTAYVEQQQNAIRSMNTLLPIMGAVCIALACLLAWFSKSDLRSRNLLIGAALLLLVAGMTTRFGNQPINAIVMQWSPKSPPANWMQLRDQWWQWHVVRSLAAIAALSLSIVAVLVGARKQP